MDPGTILSIAGVIATTLSTVVGVLWKTWLDAHKERVRGLEAQLELARVENGRLSARIDDLQEKRVGQLAQAITAGTEHLRASRENTESMATTIEQMKDMVRQLLASIGRSP